ncbi:MAG: hypothetical protein K6E10_10320 [Eubacterium sp.]|nr:hypothetical protein [Eubacterium sp.]
MANEVMDTKKNKKGIINNEPKVCMILNGITAAIWIFITVMKIYSLNKYGTNNSFSPIFTGALSLVYIGLTIEYARRFVKAKKLERGE